MLHSRAKAFSPALVRVNLAVEEPSPVGRPTHHSRVSEMAMDVVGHSPSEVRVVTLGRFMNNHTQKRPGHQRQQSEDKNYFHFLTEIIFKS